MKYNHNPNSDRPHIHETHIEGVPADKYVDTRIISAIVVVLAVAVVVGIKMLLGDGAINYGLYAVGGLVVAGVILFRVLAGHWPMQGSGRLEL